MQDRPRRATLRAPPSARPVRHSSTPSQKATQVLHILGPAAHAARAFELDAGADRNVGADYIEKARGLAGPVVVSVLMRYPNAPSGRGRVGELLRTLDTSLRQSATDR